MMISQIVYNINTKPLDNSLDSFDLLLLDFELLLPIILLSELIRYLITDRSRKDDSSLCCAVSLPKSFRVHFLLVPCPMS